MGGTAFIPSDQWDLVEIAAAILVVIVLAAAAIGTARLASPLFESLRLRLHGPPEPRFTRRAVRLLSAALASFALLVAAHVRTWSDLPLLLIALAMGVSIAARLYRSEERRVGKECGRK